MERFRREPPRNAPILLLGLAMAVAAALVLGFAWHTTYYADTWELLLDRRDPSVDTLLSPHNEHLVIFPILITELFLRIFGMTSATPELFLLVAFLSGTAAMVFVFVERRAGSWLALFAAVLILFLGPAYEVLLWPFEITFVGPVFFGLAALLTLERDDRLGDLLACAFLVLGLGFSNLGLPFVVGAAVAVFLGPRARWRSRAFVWVVPALLFVAWYVGWGHEAETHLSAHTLLDSPAFVANSIAVAVGAPTGLGTQSGLIVDVSWGRIFALALAVGIFAWLRTRWRQLDRALWPILVVAVLNWVLTAFNAFAGREPTSSRYQYVGTIFVLLILACLLRGITPTRNWLIAGGALVALAVGPNVVVLHEASKNYEREARLTRADTAALEIAERTVEPGFQLNPEIAGTPALVNVFAGPYAEAVDEYGSPAYSEAELAAAPEEDRAQADVVLANALPLKTTTETGSAAAAAGSSCTRVGGGEAGEVEVSVGKTSIEIGADASASLSMRRFAEEQFAVVLGSAPAGSTVTVEVPRDTSSRPWRLKVESGGTVRVCGGRASG